MGMKRNAMAARTSIRDIPQTVQRSRRLRPSWSQYFKDMPVKQKLVTATTLPTAIGLLEPTMLKSVAE